MALMNRAGSSGGSKYRAGLRIMGKTTNKYLPERRDGTDRVVLDNSGHDGSRIGNHVRLSKDRLRGAHAKRAG